MNHSSKSLPNIPGTGNPVRRNGQQRPATMPAQGSRPSVGSSSQRSGRQLQSTNPSLSRNLNDAFKAALLRKATEEKRKEAEERRKEAEEKLKLARLKARKEVSDIKEGTRAPIGLRPGPGRVNRPTHLPLPSERLNICNNIAEIVDNDMNIEQKLSLLRAKGLMNEMKDIILNDHNELRNIIQEHYINNINYNRDIDDKFLTFICAFYSWFSDNNDNKISFGKYDIEKNNAKLYTNLVNYMNSHIKYVETIMNLALPNSLNTRENEIYELFVAQSIILIFTKKKFNIDYTNLSNILYYKYLKSYRELFGDYYLYNIHDDAYIYASEKKDISFEVKIFDKIKNKEIIKYFNYPFSELIDIMMDNFEYPSTKWMILRKEYKELIEATARTCGQKINLIKEIIYTLPSNDPIINNFGYIIAGFISTELINTKHNISVYDFLYLTNKINEFNNLIYDISTKMIQMTQNVSDSVAYNDYGTIINELEKSEKDFMQNYKKIVYYLIILNELIYLLVDYYYENIVKYNDKIINNFINKKDNNEIENIDNYIRDVLLTFIPENDTIVYEEIEKIKSSNNYKKSNEINQLKKIAEIIIKKSTKKNKNFNDDLTLYSRFPLLPSRPIISDTKSPIVANRTAQLKETSLFTQKPKQTANPSADIADRVKNLAMIFKPKDRPLSIRSIASNTSNITFGSVASARPRPISESTFTSSAKSTTSNTTFASSRPQSTVPSRPQSSRPQSTISAMTVKTTSSRKPSAPPLSRPSSIQSSQLSPEKIQELVKAGKIDDDELFELLGISGDPVGHEIIPDDDLSSRSSRTNTS